jgi:hypothetical protein
MGRERGRGALCRSMACSSFPQLLFLLLASAWLCGVVVVVAIVVAGGEILLSSPSGVLSSASSRLTPSSRPTKMRRALWESTQEATTSPDVTALLQCCVGDRHCSLTIPSTVHTTQTTVCDAILQHSIEVSLSILWV